jgi:predicted nucleic acid-binding protein
VALIRELMRRPLVATDSGLVLDALGLKRPFQLSYRDAAIIAAAKVLGASVLYSEDLNNGQDYGRVRVENPFRR